MRNTVIATAAALALGAPALAQPYEAAPPGAYPAAPPPSAYPAAPPPSAYPAAPPPGAYPPPGGAEPASPAPMPPFMQHMRAGSAAAGTADADATAGPWAHEPGTGVSGPASGQASNLGAADTRSDIAPHFASPPVGPGGGPESYLMAASQALRDNRTGEAQQALEMAETRLLDRSTPVGVAGQPDQDPRVQAVSQALQALGRRDLAGAQNAIQAAMRGGPPG